MNDIYVYRNSFRGQFGEYVTSTESPLLMETYLSRKDPKYWETYELKVIGRWRCKHAKTNK